MKTYSPRPKGSENVECANVLELPNKTIPTLNIKWAIKQKPQRLWNCVAHHRFAYDMFRESRERSADESCSNGALQNVGNVKLWVSHYLNLLFCKPFCNLNFRHKSERFLTFLTVRRRLICFVWGLTLNTKVMTILLSQLGIWENKPINRCQSMMEFLFLGCVDSQSSHRFPLCSFAQIRRSYRERL